MKKYLKRVREQRKQNIKETRLDIKAIDGFPCLVCEGKLVRNIYTAEVRQDQYGFMRGTLHIEGEFVT